MDIYEAMQARHSVRSYQDKEIEPEIIEVLQNEIAKCNQEGGLSIQLLLNDQAVFKGLLPNMVGFRNVSNYIALVGPVDEDSETKLGYFGEQLVLKAQQLGLNTCWVGGTFNRKKCQAVVKENEMLTCVIAIGYGTTQGEPHKTKPMTELCKVDQEMPAWFERGMEAAMLAPTAMNKQNFLIELKEDQVHFSIKESKFSQIDLGIVKYHFEEVTKLSR